VIPGPPGEREEMMNYIIMPIRLQEVA